MRTTTVQSYNPAPESISVRNNNSSNAILDGMPVFFDNNNVSSVYLGVDVKRYSEALGVSPIALFAGILRIAETAGLAKGFIGEAFCYGFTDAVVVRRTRAASTDTWATIASIGAGAQLVPETANNYLTFSQTLAVGAAAYPIVAGESVDSLATGASTYLSGSTAETTRMKVFVRAM